MPKNTAKTTGRAASSTVIPISALTPTPHQVTASNLSFAAGSEPLNERL
jgi:hypothetical protein